MRTRIILTCLVIGASILFANDSNVLYAFQNKIFDDTVSDSTTSSSQFFDPIERDIEGWKVLVEPDLLEGDHETVGRESLKMLANHLQRIKIVIPQPALEKLQTIEIWIEREHPRSKTMCYHPSKAWLIANDHDPRLARTVHIPRARELLSREQMLKHPAVILHELAHAYHDQFLGFENAEIAAAYEKGKAGGNYEEVLDHRGETVRHYGMNNAKEYFAEGTEAYFYRNDFFPFVRAELKEHDLILHDLLGRVWLEANASDKH